MCLKHLKKLPKNQQKKPTPAQCDSPMSMQT